MELNEALDYVQDRLLVELAAYKKMNSSDALGKAGKLENARTIAATWAKITQALLALTEYRERDITEEVERIKQRYE